MPTLPPLAERPGRSVWERLLRLSDDEAHAASKAIRFAEINVSRLTRDGQADIDERLTDVRFTPIADIAGRQLDVRFVPQPDERH